jgi:hypothetical protein
MFSFQAFAINSFYVNLIVQFLNNMVCFKQFVEIFRIYTKKSRFSFNLGFQFLHAFWFNADSMLREVNLHRTQKSCESRIFIVDASLDG